MNNHCSGPFVEIFSAPNSSCSLTPVPQQKVQLVLIGDRNVGKTCVLERFTENMFHDDLVSTVGRFHKSASTLSQCIFLDTVRFYKVPFIWS